MHVLNLNDIFKRASQQSGSRVFMRIDGTKKSFREAYEDSLKFAAGLKHLGVKKGDRVAMLLNNSMEFVIAYFGVIYLGAEVVPFNTFLGIEEVAYIMNDCRAKIFITSRDFNPIIKDMNVNRIPALQDVVIIGVDDLPISHMKFSDVFKEEYVEPEQISDNDTAAIIYTSGTTGHPKGAMLSHRNLIANVESATSAIKVTKRDRFILFLPMFHAFSFTVNVLCPIYMQCYIRIFKSVQPFTPIIKALFLDRITIFAAIPQVFNVLSMKKIPPVFMWLIKIRVCISGAAPLAGEVLRRFEKKFKLPLLEGYGLSEASPVVSVNLLNAERKPGSVGPAIPGVYVRIAGDDGGDLKCGEIGEICVRGENIMKGYFNMPEETAEVIKDGWLHTGDIGRLDEDGYIYIVDRKKDLIIVNGMNLYPREAEEVLYRHNAVEEAAVVGKKDISHGEVPVGVIRLKEGKSVTEAELKKFCRAHLASFKVPHKFEFWPELPKNGTGKILKMDIRRILNER
ncbi:MAG: long-chain fatty acid--CoA ligase [Spirochaetia bacterium]|nr:long-chain fatty acid--CoA ligase [Spirochaetia bacterium]